MSLSSFAALAGRVPLPDMPGTPEGYTLSLGTTVFGAISILLIAALIPATFYGEFGPKTGPESYRPYAWICAALMVSIVPCYLFQQADSRAASQRLDAHSAQRDQIQAAQVELINDHYGVEITIDPHDVPLVWITEEAVDVTRADGQVQTCWLGAPDLEYELHCGGPTFDSSTELAPAH